MKYRIVTDVTTEPITLAEAKAHLRVVDDTDNDYISQLIGAAREYAEGYHDCSYGTKTIEAVSDELLPVFDLPVKPAASVTSVKWLDKENQEHDVTSSYALDIYTSNLIQTAEVDADTESFGPLNPVRITYTSGTTPRKRTKQAMLIMIGEWYENREDSVIGVGVYQLPLASKQLLDMDRHPEL